MAHPSRPQATGPESGRATRPPDPAREADPSLPARSGGEPAAARAGVRERLRRHALPLVILWVTALVIGGATMANNRLLSPIDEAAHLDYVLSMPARVPPAGDPMSQETLEIYACRGGNVAEVLPARGAAYYEPGAYPWDGYGLAGTHPPVYYLVTAGVGAVVRAIGPLDTLDSFRAVGLLWFGAALTATYALSIRLGARRSTAVGVALLVAATGETVTSAATIGPDVAAWFAGGLVLLAAVHHRGRRADTAILLAACLFAASVKLTCLLAVGAAMIFLVVRRPLGVRAPGGYWREWATASAAGLVFVVPSLAWMTYAASLATKAAEEIPQSAAFVLDGDLPLGAVAAQVTAFLSPIFYGYVADFMTGSLELRTGAFSSMVILLGTLTAVVAGRARPVLCALGIGVAVLTIVGGPLMTVANYLTSESFFPMNPRYGMPLVAGMAALTAATFDTPALRRAMLVTGAVMVAVLLAQALPLGLGAA